MLQGMKKLKRGFCNAIYLYPLDRVDVEPKVVIVEDPYRESYVDSPRILKSLRW